MSQILHIFRKDARRHWPEVIAYLYLLIVFTAYQPRVWTNRPIAPHLLAVILKILPMLLALAGIFLTVRLVQGETLVGDQQFWITRPYEWHKLLAAKVLAILVFIHLPLFIAQVFLLKLAQFPLIPSLKGLLFIQWSLALTMTLAAVTLGSVTAGIGQASLGLLATILLVLGIAGLTTFIPNIELASAATDNWQEAVYLSGCIVVILTQYVFRRTLLARLIVAGGCILVLLLVVLPPYGKLVARSFPPPTKDQPLPGQFAFDRTLSFDHSSKSGFDGYGDEVRLQIPLRLTNLADNQLAQVRGVKLDLNLPDGGYWTSEWESTYDSVSPDRKRYWPSITIKRAIFNRMKDAKVKGRLTLGFNIFRLGAETEVRIMGDTVRLPSNARCLNKFQQNEMECFEALKQPGPIVMTATLPSASCPVVEDAAREPWAGSSAAYINLAGDGSAEFDFTPIQQFTVNLSRFYILEDLRVPLPICSGTRLLVNTPTFVYSTRTEIDLGEINLMNYLPIYPRKIVPPAQKWTPGERSDTLSWSLPPPSVAGSLEAAIHFSRR